MDYRIIKYNKANWNTDWTSFYDLLKEYDFDAAFAIYKETEDKFINIFEKLLFENNITKMKILELEHYTKVGDRIITNKRFYKKIKNGNDYSVEEIKEIIRLCLREVIWCKIIWENIYIHIGYDYYTYIGGIEISNDFITNESQNGITIEKFKSPYLEDLKI